MGGELGFDYHTGFNQQIQTGFIGEMGLYPGNGERKLEYSRIIRRAVYGNHHGPGRPVLLSLLPDGG